MDLKNLKINDRDKGLCFYFVMNHRQAFRDKYMPVATGRYYKLRYYQIPPALTDNITVFGGRSIGKSYELEISIIQTMINAPNDESLLTSFRKTHIKDREEKVITYLQQVPYFRAFYKGIHRTALGSVSRSPIYSITLRNGHNHLAISIGDDPAAVMIQGHHPCLHPDQGVRLSNGKYLAIRKIISKLHNKEKVYVKSYDKKTNSIVNKRVTDGWGSLLGDKKMLRIFLEDNSNFQATNNHKVYIEKNGKYIFKRVDELKINKDYILTDEPNLTKGQLSLAVGTLLGDGCLTKETWYRDGKRKGAFKKRRNLKDASCRLICNHASSHYDYVKFKYDILSNLCTDKGVSINKQHINAYGHECAVFGTKCLTIFDRLYQKFYFKGKKIISNEILELIDNKALAIWFMDDGSLERGRSGVIRSLYLHTEGFSEKENHIILKWFYDKHNIKFKIQKSKKYFLLIANRENALKFLQLIIPYIHPLLAYKVVNIEMDIKQIGNKINEFFIEKRTKLLSKKVIAIKKGNFTIRVCDLTIEDTGNMVLSGRMIVKNCYRFMEEAQSYPNAAWVKWQSTQDPKGSIDRYFGTVDGRSESPFRKLDTTIDKFKNARFHIPRLLDPHFNQEIKRNLIESFGGEESNEYLHQCLAEWGEPMWGVWDEKAISDCLDKKEDSKFPGLLINKVKIVEITAKDYRGLTPDQALIDLLPLPKTEQKIDVILGIDAGYTSPTVVLPFFLYEHKWNLRCRIMLKEKMIPDDQAELIDYIADFYNAGIISLDTTSSEGRAPATSLTNPKNKKYINKNYAERVVMASFQTKMIMGYTADGTEISDNVKNGTTTILRQMFAREEFLLYNDEDLLEEFNREVKKKTKETISISTPQNVHIPDAFRCFAFGYFAKYGGVEKPSKKVNYEFQYPVYKNILRLFGK